MTKKDMAIRAYASARATTRTARSIEYEALAIVTRRLERCARNTHTGLSDLAQALHDNRRLWSVFASDVANPENPLPNELKAGIYSLAAFTSQETSRILSRHGDINALVDINISILRGLRSEAA